MTESKAIAKVELVKREGLEVLGGVEEMRQRMEATQERLALAHEFIDFNFIEKVDFGPADPRNPKPTLLKPGAEKVCKLFNTRPIWTVDKETWEMLGSKAGTVCYKCEIVSNVTGEVVGEGRGAEQVGNRGRDANKAIKIAEKCALVDAVLYTFGLSERFTQDSPTRTDDLNGAKQELIAAVGDLRTGVESTLTDLEFIVLCNQNHIHRKDLNTVGAVKKMFKAIVTDGLFDLATGDRIPDDLK